MITIQNIQSIVGMGPSKKYKVIRIDEDNNNYYIEIKRVIFDPNNLQPFSLVIKLSRHKDQWGRISLLCPGVEMLLMPDHIKSPNDFMNLLNDIIEAHID